MLQFTSGRRARLCRMSVLPLLLLGCSASTEPVATPDLSGSPTSMESSARPQSEESAAAVGSLPVEVVWVDLAGPATLAEAVEASEDVVVATVEESTAGVRFVGSNPKEDLAGPLYEEVVGLRLRVEQVLKGDEGVGDEFMLNWPAYMTSRKDSSSRTAIMEIEGVARELAPNTPYLFMVKDFGEPWGLSQISPAYSVAEVDTQGRLNGAMSTGFEVLRGQPVSALPGIDAGPPVLD